MKNNAAVRILKDDREFSKNELAQLGLDSFQEIDKAMKSEGIRLIAYPSDALRKSTGSDKARMEERVQEIVSEVNKELQAYKKITMVTVADEPLPMTSTKKVKRFEVKARFDKS